MCIRDSNKVVLIGNLGRDPETRHTASGSQVTNLNLATAESWTDNAGNKQDRTEWHRVVIFGKLAEIASQYLHKGSKVYIEGSLRTSQYEKDGITRYSTDVIARELLMLDSRSDSQGSSYNQPNQQPRQQPTQQPAFQQSAQPAQQALSQSQQPQQQASQNVKTPDAGNFEQFDDDIPF